ncbi:flagellar assembly protein FliW [Myxococcota bacterium]|nr:flagellar assembly protein FliW [Myxococcota bacterium]
MSDEVSTERSVRSSRFGALSLDAARVVEFPAGLPGFDTKRFVLVDEPRSPHLCWLQSTREPDAALLLASPRGLGLDYAVEAKPGELFAIQSEGRAPDPLSIWVVTRAGERPGELLLNLFAPIFLNPRLGLALQLPLVGSGYGLREVYPPRPDAPRSTPGLTGDPAE